MFSEKIVLTNECLNFKTRGKNTCNVLIDVEQYGNTSTGLTILTMQTQQDRI